MDGHLVGLIVRNELQSNGAGRHRSRQSERLPVTIPYFGGEALDHGTAERGEHIELFRVVIGITITGERDR